MPNWKKVIVSGSSAELNSLNVTSEFTASGLNYPTSDGTDGQALITDGAGGLTFGFPTNADDAEKVTFAVQNDFTSTLQKGTPIHITSTTNGTSLVIPASASDASTMPAHGILNAQLAVGVDGEATVIGQITGVDTSGFSSGDTVYVGPNGGYTNVKPQGSGNLIQNLGVVKKVDASNGTGEIFGSGRSNDIPNLPEGKIWVGSSTYTVTSSVVHLDESNQRVGINTNNPTYQLHVSSSTAALGVYERAGGAALYLEGQSTRGVMGTVGTHPLIFAYNSVETARFTGNSLLVTGSLDVQSGVTASSYTGSYYGDGSGITGIISSSYAVTASHALNAGGSTALSFSYFNVSNTSLADNTTYRLGQMTGLQTSINAFAHVPLPAGTITEAYIECYVAGTIPSNENITVNFLSDEGATTDTISSAVNFSTTSRHKNFLITGLSIPINAGGTFIEIDTPAFATNPTAVQFRIGIKLEL